METREITFPLSHQQCQSEKEFHQPATSIKTKSNQISRLLQGFIGECRFKFTSIPEMGKTEFMDGCSLNVRNEL